MTRYLSLLVLLSSTTALAQALPETHGPIADEAAAAEGGDASSIVITGMREHLAQRTSAGTRLNLTSLETPATVAVLSGDDLRNFGYQSLIEAETRAPGITSVPFPGNGNNSLSARGFYGPNSVSQLYDGFQLYNGGGVNAFPFDPWNVERVEVLYGPASILYGTGFIGGAINVVPKRPDFAGFHVRGEGSFGSFDTGHAALDVTGPLSRTLAFRASASGYRSDGYVDRGNSKSIAAYVALAWQPTETLQFTIADDYGDTRPGPYEGTPTLNGRVIERLRDRNYNVDGAKLRFRENRSYARAAWTPSAAISVSNDLYYIDHYRKYQEVYTYAYLPATDQVRRTQYRDIDGYQKQIGDHGFATWKAGGDGIRNELVVGFDVNHAKYDRYDNTNAAGSFPNGGDLVSASNPVPGSFFPLGTRDRFTYTVYLDQVALFAQDRVILTPQLSVIASGRRDWYDTDRKDRVTGARTTGQVAGTSYSVGAVYNPIPTISLYAQYAVASDPATSLASIGPAQQPYALSKGRQIEGGVKGVLFGGKVEATLSVYRIVKNNLLTPIPNTTLQDQVGQQSSRGVEGSVSVHPTRTIAIDANGAYTKARFDDFNTGSGASLRSLKGYRPQFIPKTTANLRATWSVLRDWQVRGGVHVVGTRYSDNANTFRLPHYATAEFGLGWAFIRNARLDLRIENAFDRLYAASTYAGNTTQIILGSPRAVTGSLKFSF